MLRHIIITIIFFCTGNVFAAVNMQLDRTEMKVDEIVTMVISSDDHLSLSPDLSPLRKDFNIVGTSQNSQFNIINGKTSMSVEWQVALMPTHAGDIEIPAIQVGNEKTNVQIIHVEKNAKPSEKATNDHNAFIEASINRHEAFIQEQFVYTVKLFAGRTIESPYLAAPDLADAKIIQNGQDIIYTTVKNGRYYTVLERSYLITPQKTGKLQVQPPIFKGYMESATGLRDPYGFPGHAVRPIKIVGPTLEIMVKPKPANFVGKWFPAKNVTLNATWEPDPAIFREGEPFARVFEVTAQGATADQIPAISIDPILNINQYPETPERDTQSHMPTQTGRLKQKIVFIPTASGKMTLPAIKLRWWNTVTQKEQVAVLPKQVIQVMPGLTNHGASPKSPSSIHKAIVKTQPDPSPVVKTSPRHNYFWPIIAILFLVIWLLTVYLWRRQLKSQKELGSKYSLKELNAQLKAACLKNNPKFTRSVFLQWAALHWKKNDIHSLSDILHILESTDTGLTGEIMKLEEIFYSEHKIDWNGKTFWSALNTYLEKTENPQTTNNDPLPPLYCQ